GDVSSGDATTANQSHSNLAHLHPRLEVFREALHTPDSLLLARVRRVRVERERLAVQPQPRMAFMHPAGFAAIAGLSWPVRSRRPPWGAGPRSIIGVGQWSGGSTDIGVGQWSGGSTAAQPEATWPRPGADGELHLGSDVGSSIIRPARAGGRAGQGHGPA